MTMDGSMTGVWRPAEDERQLIVEFMAAVAWADGRVSRRELAALRAAVRVFTLGDESLGRVFTLPASEAPQQAFVPPSDRLARVTYACAVWVALIDDVVDPGQRRLLQRIRRRLGLEEHTAATVEDWVWQRMADVDELPLSGCFRNLVGSVAEACVVRDAATSAA